jgi:Tfp pilus assembly protein PilF
MTRFSVVIILLIGFLSTSCSLFSGPDKMTTEEKKAELYYDHGTSKLMSKDYTEALDYLLKARDLEPKSSKIHNNLGMAYYFKGESNNAVKHLKLAVEYDEKNADAKNNLASLYFNLGKIQDAERLYHQILKNLVYKKQYRIYYNLALISLKKGQNFKAKDYLKQSIKEKDDYCIAHLKLGQLEEKSFQFKTAMKHYKDAVNGVCYDFPASHYFLGQLYSKLNDNKNAEAEFRTIMDKFKTSQFAAFAEKRLHELVRDRIYPQDIDGTTQEIQTKNNFQSPSF